MLRIDLFGGLRVERDGKPVELASVRRRDALTLLKLLALAPAHETVRERAVEAIGPGRSTIASGHALHNALLVLRRLLEPDRPLHAPSKRVRLSAQHICLTTGDDLSIDVAEFEAHLSAAASADEEQRLAAAIALYRGPLLPEDPDAPWAALARERYARMAVAALRRLAELQRARSAQGDALASLRRLLDIDPTDEAVHRSVMEILSAQGQRSAALRQFVRCEQALAKELAAEPGAETIALRDRIRRGQIAAPTPPVPKRNEARIANVPSPPGALIGRAAELAALDALLDDPTGRLVTLVGPPGVGKSRLAQEIARRAATAGARDVVWVALDAVAQAELVPTALAHALGLDGPAADNADSTLKARIGERPLLAVLDNVEHLLGAVPWLATLLGACPKLQILATSRTALYSAFERRFEVEPLRLPTSSEAADPARLAHVASAALFAERCRAVRGDFAIDAANAQAVANICIALDGLPLALEYAAARVSILSPQAMLPLLSRQLELADRGPRDASPRQRSLRSALQWSADLLPQAAQTLLARLASFAGSFSLAAIEAVAAGGDDELAALGAPLLDALAALVDSHLLRLAEDDGDVPRYTMLASVREFAAEQMDARGEGPVLRARHARYFASLAGGDGMRFDAQEAARLARIEVDLPNFRAALRFAAERSDRSLGLDIAAPLVRLWISRGRCAEGLRWLEILLALEATTAAAGPKLYHAQAHAGVLARRCGRPSVAEHFLQAALATARSSGDAKQIGAALSNLATVSMVTGDLAVARARLEEALAIFGTAGYAMGIGHALNNLGLIALQQGEPQLALDYCGQTAKLYAELQSPYGQMQTLLRRVTALIDLGDLTRAASVACEVLQNTRRDSTIEFLLTALEIIVPMLPARGQYGLAARVLAATSAFREQAGEPFETAYERRRIEATRSAVEAVTGPVEAPAIFGVELFAALCDEALQALAPSGSV
jgi:predicted ATPase/DNA-binding SARP family transcriptional activator